MVKLLYNVIWGRGVLKNWHFLLYNMWTAPTFKTKALYVSGPRLHKTVTLLTFKTNKQNN